MKKFLFALFCCLSTISCSSCAPKEQTQPATPAPSCSDSTCPMPSASTSSSSLPPPVVLDKAVKVQNDNWEFVLPDSGWVKVPVNEDGIQLVMKNNERNNLVVFLKEKFDNSIEQYTLLAVRGIKDAGGTLLSVKQVELNGMKFSQLESSKPNVRIWMWVGIKSGVAYGLTCGGPVVDDNDSSQATLCTKVASTLKVK